MRPTTRRGRFALGIFAILALGIVGVFGFGIYEEYAYIPGETFVIAPCETAGRIALRVDGGDQARATGITIGGVTYAEAFMRSSAEVFDALPLAERSLKRDEHTMHRAYSEGVNPWDVPVEPSPTTKYFESKE